MEIKPLSPSRASLKACLRFALIAAGAEALLFLLAWGAWALFRLPEAMDWYAIAWIVLPAALTAAYMLFAFFTNLRRGYHLFLGNAAILLLLLLFSVFAVFISFQLVDPEYLFPQADYSPFGTFVVAFGFAFALALADLVVLQFLLLARKLFVKAGGKALTAATWTVGVAAALFQPAVAYLLFRFGSI